MSIEFYYTKGGFHIKEQIFQSNMLPVIAQFGFVTIYTFGVFLMLAFFWGSFVLWKNILLTSYKEDDVFDALFIACTGGFITGRLLHIVLHFEDFRFSFMKMILINGYPGMSFVGVIIGGLFFLNFALVSKKIPYIKLFDHVAPSLMLAIAIGKLGAFFSGVEIGTQTTFFLAMKLPHLDGMRHLTPLYQSLCYFAFAYFTHIVLINIRREKLPVGFNFFVFLTGYSMISFIFDPLLSFRTMFGGFSLDFVIHGIILIASLVYYSFIYRKILFSFSRKKN